MRLYYNEEGQHITAYIFRENLFAASYDSFLEQAPGLQHLETLEDCELLCLSREAMDQLYQDLPAMNILT
jgi:CRP-like cAMP-binding protein